MKNVDDKWGSEAGPMSAYRKLRSLSGWHASAAQAEHASREHVACVVLHACLTSSCLGHIPEHDVWVCVSCMSYEFLSRACSRA